MNHSPLARSALDGNMSGVQYQLAHGAPLDGSDGGLYEEQTDGCITGAPYYTPLGEAARMGHIEIVRTLLDAGAPIDFQDYRGETALIQACNSDQLKSVELLLERGANVHIVGCLGTALCVIQPGWRPNALDIAQLLLARGASPLEKADYCDSAIEKWTELPRVAAEKKIAPKVLALLQLLLPHAGERAPDVSAAIDTLEKKLGKSAAKDKKAAQGIAQLAQASGKGWPSAVHKAAGSIDKNGETIHQIITTVLPAQGAVVHPQWPAVVRDMIRLSKSYADATKATYGRALPLSKLESDEGPAMEYLADEHLYTWDWILTMLGQPAPQSHALWSQLVREVCEAKQKAVGYYSFGDDEIAALLTQPSVKTRDDFALLVAIAKKAFPYASCFGGNGELRDFGVSAKGTPAKGTPKRAAPKKAAPKKAAPKKAPPKKAPLKKAPLKKAPFKKARLKK